MPDPLNPSARNRLATQYETLFFLTDGLGVGQLSWSPAPGKWSIHENLAHLGRYQQVFADRLHRVLSEEDPAFERYRAEDDPGFKSWVERSNSKILAAIREQRVDLIGQVNALSPRQFSQSGNHPKLGKMPVALWVEFFLLHEAHHLYTIFWIRQTQLPG